MGADQQGLVVGVTVAADDVAGTVHTGGQLQGFQPTHQPFTRLHVGIGKSLAVDALIFRVVTDASQGVDVLLDAFQIDG